MRIGYAGLNYSVGCTPASTFRLNSYSNERLRATLRSNIECLEKILHYNLDRGLLFFRITSDLVPFASHPVCDVDWLREFEGDFKRIGAFVENNKMRVSMHPGQFTVLNSLEKSTRERAVKEIEYHVKALEAMGLDFSAKINIHVGGVYGDKKRSLKRFVQVYNGLPVSFKNRLVIENDERSYNADDCFDISQATGVPVAFDFFHHQLLGGREDLREVVLKLSRTWEKKDGTPIIHYSSQAGGKRRGGHADSLDRDDFRFFLHRLRGIDYDLVLEIKDKEKSAQKALTIAQQLEII